jgi:hypothetical protein
MRTIIKARIGKYLSDAFAIQNGLTQGDALSPVFPTLLWNMPLGMTTKTRWGIKWDTSAVGLC